MELDDFDFEKYQFSLVAYFQLSHHIKENKNPY
jgi:hypothetical protein